MYLSVDWIEALMDVRHGVRLQQGDHLEEFSEADAIKASPETELIRLAERVGPNVFFNHQSTSLRCDATVADWRIELIARGVGS